MRTHTQQCDDTFIAVRGHIFLVVTFSQLVQLSGIAGISVELPLVQTNIVFFTLKVSFSLVVSTFSCSLALARYARVSLPPSALFSLSLSLSLSFDKISLVFPPHYRTAVPSSSSSS
jgi:hypothetical protein